jgi:uncharacterized repeat protein (TIGR03803 family)
MKDIHTDFLSIKTQIWHYLIPRHRFLLAFFVGFAMQSLPIAISAQNAELYGMTSNGGSGGAGTLFKCSLDGSTSKVLQSLEGSNADGNLRGGVIEYEGKLYGMTGVGGTYNAGTLFSYDLLSNTYTVLKSFTRLYSDGGGYDPHGNLIVYKGKLFGVTSSGGNNGKGTMFCYEVSSGTYTKLKDFNNNDGDQPYGSLISFNDKLYGMTQTGGITGAGVIFSYDPLTGVYTKLKDFNNSDGGYPTGSLTQYNGKLYGMTSSGGSTIYGVIFSFDLATNTYTKLKEFNVFQDGGSPNGSLIVYMDKLYGMTSQGGTSNNGTIFSYDISTSSFNKLKDFTSTDGSTPVGSLMQYKDKLYGMTAGGGANGNGVIFSYNLTNNTYIKNLDFTNDFGKQGYGDLLAICKIPTISNKPAPFINFCDGQTVSLTAQAIIIAGDMTIKWQRKGLNDAEYSDIPNTASSYNSGVDATYTTPPLSIEDNGALYRAVFTGCGGSVNTEETRVIINAMPKIVSNPIQISTVCDGSTAMFLAIAKGDDVLKIQWQRKGVTDIDFVDIVNTASPYISGSDAIYVTPPLSNANNGAIYRARFTNCVGSVFTSETTIQVIPIVTPNVILSASTQNTICSGTPVTFSTKAINGGTAPQYRWFRNNIEIQVTRGDTYNTSSLVNGDNIKVIMTSNVRCVTSPTDESKTITMEVNKPRVDAGTCQFVYLGYGSNCKDLTAVASGSAGNFKYSWSTGGKKETITVCPTATTNYTVTASDNKGCEATATVKVEVVDVRCGSNLSQVSICQNGVSTCINSSQVATRLSQGATLGKCGLLKPCSVNNVQIMMPTNSQSPNICSAIDIKAFPNPADNIITLQLSNSTEGVTQFDILDIAGKIVKSENRIMNKDFNEVRLDIHTLSSGLYLIRIKDSDNHTATMKINKL